MSEIGEASSEFNLTCVPAIKDHKKGQAKGGILMAINKEIRSIKREGYGERILEWQIMYNKER